MGDIREEDSRDVIVFLDDDKRILDDYQKGLQLFSHESRTYKVLAFQRPTEALGFLRTAQIRRCLCVIDSMMPIDDAFSEEESESGLTTGAAVVRQIALLKDRWEQFSCFLLTNFSIDILKRKLEDLDFNPKLVPKLQATPKTFAGHVDQVLARWRIA